MKDTTENTWNFTPVNTRKAYELVYDALREQILNGDLTPGDVLPSERELMKLFKRSQPTIREAICMLERDGFVEVNPGGKTYVMDITIDYFYQPLMSMLIQHNTSNVEIVEYLHRNEPIYLEQVASSCSDTDIERLAEFCNSYSCANDSINTYAKYDCMFHDMLHELSGNTIALVVCSILRKLMWKNGVETFESMPAEQRRNVFNETHEEHLAVVEALKSRNNDEVKRVFTYHLARALER